MPRWWTDHAVPRLADLSLRGHDVGELRGRACEGLSGEVVELGFGSGLNARWYPAEVTRVLAVEPSDVGWRLSGRRRERSPAEVVRAGLDGQHLALPDDSADHALVTFSLCTIPDPLLALRETARVVRPGGRLHFVEHGLHPDPQVARRQRRLDPWQRRIAGGCHLSRDVLAMLADGGWAVQWSQSRQLPGPRFAAPWTWVTLGVAELSPDV
jgi:SAM-dependent methyltransferase